MEEPLVNRKYKLEKFQGKGGWTYVLIPEILPDKHAHFGLVRVKGSIDKYHFRSCNLMSARGQLFLPVKAEIRKLIGKKEGDWVDVTLYPDSNSLDIPKNCFYAFPTNQMPIRPF